MFTPSKFFNFKQRLVLNSNQIDMSNVGLKITRLDNYFNCEYKLESEAASNPNIGLIKSESVDSDYVNFNCNY